MDKREERGDPTKRVKKGGKRERRRVSLIVPRGGHVNNYRDTG